MEIFVDDSQVDSAFAADHTLEDVVRHVQEHLCAPGFLVVGVRCDGEQVLSDAMASRLREPASNYERLDVVTNTAEVLVSDALKEASTVLDDASRQCEEVANLLVEGKTADGIGALGECLGAWQQIHDAAVKSIGLLAIDPEQITVGGRPFGEVLEQPKAALEQIKEALLAQDYVLLADILQYEFSSVTEMWQVLLDTLSKRAEENRNGPT